MVARFEGRFRMFEIDEFVVEFIVSILNVSLAIRNRHFSFKKNKV